MANYAKMSIPQLKKVAAGLGINTPPRGRTKLVKAIEAAEKSSKKAPKKAAPKKKAPKKTSKKAAPVVETTEVDFEALEEMAKMAVDGNVLLGKRIKDLEKEVAALKAELFDEEESEEEPEEEVEGEEVSLEMLQGMSGKEIRLLLKDSGAENLPRNASKETWVGKAVDFFELEAEEEEEEEVSEATPEEVLEMDIKELKDFIREQELDISLRGRQKLETLQDKVFDELGWEFPEEEEEPEEEEVEEDDVPDFSKMNKKKLLAFIEDEEIEFDDDPSEYSVKDIREALTEMYSEEEPEEEEEEDEFELSFDMDDIKTASKKELKKMFAEVNGICEDLEVEGITFKPQSTVKMNRGMLMAAIEELTEGN